MASIKNALCIASLDAMTSLVDQGGAASLVIYSGPPPQTVDAEIDPSVNTALATFEMANPAFDGAVDTTDGAARASANPIAATPVDAAGTATFYRVIDGAGNSLITGPISGPSGNGEAKLSNVDLVEGINVQVFNFSLEQPEG